MKKSSDVNEVWRIFCELWSNNEENNNTSDLWDIASDYFWKAVDAAKGKEVELEELEDEEENED